MDARMTGMGIVCCRSRGLNAFEQALRAGWVPPTFSEVPGIDRPVPAYTVPPEALKDKTVLGPMRRADRLSKMAVLAATDAWRDAGMDRADSSEVGLVVASGLGPHVRTFEFLDGILDFGDDSASPTVFSHSVHNAAASYITTSLQILGPVLTVTDFDFAFQQALTAALCWLEEGRCARVLVGAAEELGQVMLHVCARMVDLPPDGRPKPFEFSDSPSTVPGEGAVFFVLSAEESGEDYAAVSIGSPPARDADLWIMDAQGLSGTEEGYRELAPAGASLANYSPLTGGMMSGTAFQCAAAALSLRNGMRYASPVPENPHGLNVCRETKPAELEKISCLKLGASGEAAQIDLRRR